MKANRAIKNDRAEVGVGTLIVFIAMVLVAAVAAAVLINTTGTLQQRAQATGKEATQEVSSNLKVVNVFGVIDTDTDKIGQLRIVTQLAAGALPMDLEQLILRYSDGVNTYNFEWTPTYDTAGACDGADVNGPEDTEAAAYVEDNFIAVWLRPTPDTNNDYGCAGKSVMEAGDLVELRFSLDDGTVVADHTIDVRKDIGVTLIPESGSSVLADFKTPATYGSDTYHTLR